MPMCRNVAILVTLTLASTGAFCRGNRAAADRVDARSSTARELAFALPDAKAAVLLDRVLRESSSEEARHALAEYYVTKGFTTMSTLFGGTTVTSSNPGQTPSTDAKFATWGCEEDDQSYSAVRKAATAADRPAQKLMIVELQEALGAHPGSCELQVTLAYLELREALWNPALQPSVERERILRVLATTAGDSEIIPSPVTSHAAVFVSIAQLLSVNGDHTAEAVAYRLAREQAKLRSNSEFIGGTEEQIREHERVRKP